jgi:hypothetical protein
MRTSQALRIPRLDWGDRPTSRPAGRVSALDQPSKVRLLECIALPPKRMRPLAAGQCTDAAPLAGGLKIRRQAE